MRRSPSVDKPGVTTRFPSASMESSISFTVKMISSAARFLRMNFSWWQACLLSIIGRTQDVAGEPSSASSFKLSNDLSISDLLVKDDISCQPLDYNKIRSLFLLSLQWGESRRQQEGLLVAR